MKLNGNITRSINLEKITHQRSNEKIAEIYPPSPPRNNYSEKISQPGKKTLIQKKLHTFGKF